MEAAFNSRLRRLRRQLRAAEAFENRIIQCRTEGYSEWIEHKSNSKSDENTYPYNTYPDWAPELLCNRLLLLEGGYEPRTPEQNNFILVLKQLCTDARMEEIWRWLEKNFTKYNNSISYTTLVNQFSQCVFHSFYGMNGWESLTQKQGKNKINEIIDLIGKLSKILETYPVSESVLADFKTDELAELQESLVCRVLQGVRSKIPEYFSDKIERAAYEYKGLYLPNTPTLSELLGRVELRLREVNFTSVSTNGSDTGKLRYFIRNMASFMERYYGSRKDAQLAKIANVFFDTDDLDAKRVADLFRKSNS
jgi:hypothetical protein